MTFENIILVAGGTFSGLLAGLMYAFNVAVVPALRSMKPREHIIAMQEINVKIINPVFMLSFLGPTFLLPLAAYLNRDSAQFLWIVGAAVLHIVGADGVTGVGNVPLNDKLAKVDVDQLTDEQAEQIRLDYQGHGSAWMRYHNVRTLASIAATLFVFIACLVKSIE